MNSLRQNVFIFTACLVAVVGGGCAEPEPALFPVSGVVLYNDQPIPKAKLLFHPQFEGPGWMPVAIAESDGTFEASTKQPGDGVLEGRYKVTVVWHPNSDDEEGPNLLPKRYADANTSGLEVVAGPDSSDLPTFKLTD